MKMLKGLLFATVVFLCCMLVPAAGKLAGSKSSATKGLKDYYKDYFLVGVAVAPQMLHGEDSALIVTHFNSLTAENAMKMEPIHPRENEYYWKDADEIANFAKKHKMKMRGHTLLWHSQAPAWMFKNEKGDTVSKAVLYQRLKDHITTVVNRYKDRVYGWDVVNEAIDDNDSRYFTKHCLVSYLWRRIYCESF